MNREIFQMQIKLALESQSENLYIQEQGWCEWMEEYDNDADRLIHDMKNIYWLATCTMKELKEASNLPNATIAKKYDIPIRTIEDWNKKNHCPMYTKLLLAESLGLIQIDLV